MKITAWVRAIKEHAGLWTFGLLLLAAAGGIYAWTESIVGAQVSPVKVQFTSEVRRMDGRIDVVVEKIEEVKKELKAEIKEVRKDIRRLDEKFDKKFDLIFLRLPSADESRK